jgi:hypothetical protein
VGNVDELEGRLVHGGLELAISAPVAVGLLDDDRALEQQPLEDALDVEAIVAGVSDAECDVLEVAKHGHTAGVCEGRHVQAAAPGGG